MKKITSYYIDHNNTLHTFVGERKHVTFRDVKSEERAQELMEEENELI